MFRKKNKPSPRCRLCKGAGRLRVWKRSRLTGKFYSVDEVCACVKWKR
jgi:hypothetical protein